MNLTHFLNPKIDAETLKNPRLLSVWVTTGVLLVVVFSHFHLFPVPVFIAGVFGLALLWASWKWPKAVFGMLLASVPLELVPMVSFGGTDLRWYQVLAVSLAVGILLRWISGREKIGEYLKSLRWFDAVPVVILISGFVSAFQNGGVAMRQTVILASFIFLYFLVRFFVRSRKEMVDSLPFLVAPFFIVSLYGIAQNILFVFEKTSEEVMPGRPNSVFTEPDWLGLYVGLGVILASVFILSLLLQKKECTKKDQALKVLSCEMLFFAFMVLILTVARSAWLATVAGLFAMGVLLFFRSGLAKVWEWGKYVLGIGILALCVAIGFHLTRFELGNRAGSTSSGLQEITVACEENVDNAVPKTIDRVEDLVQYGCQHINLEEMESFQERGFVVQKIFRKDPSTEIRRSIWITSREEIRKNILWGIGWGNIGEKLGTDSRGTTLNSSNIFLEFWLGSGILGIVGAVMMFGYFFILNIKYQISNIRYQRSNVSSFIFSLGVLGVGVTLLVMNLFNAGQFLALFWVAFAFMAVNDSE